MDGDIISPANCVRQPFSSAEIGLAKAVVMVSRLNLFWGLNWKASPEYLSEQSKIGDFDVVIDSTYTGNQVGAFLSRTFTSADRFGKVVYQYT